MRVRIYKPAKSAAQSGRARTHQWVAEPEILTPRAPEPIMGWAGAEDTLGELKGRLHFATLEEALAFARHKGWETIIEPPAERRVTPRNYLDNFRIVRPQDEERAP
ncbi:MAG: ETC complex I subunit [Alphaproteobacteria bacterium]|nr:ETC complex I subunit [Alphaproteobacteria bacterium]